MMISLLLLMTFLHIKACLSVTLTLTGSADYAVLGQTFRFVCTVTDAEADGSQSFSRLGQATACSIFPSSCSQNGGTKDYSCGCVSRQSDVYYMNISSVSVQKDEGLWICQRRSQASNNITLPVYYGPTNDGSHETRAVTELTTLTYNCSSDCKPCSYTWRRGTVTLSSTRTLSLTNISKNQAGDYICTATNNELGTTASSTLTVDVQYGPVIQEVPSSYKVNESSRLQIDCNSYTTAGNPPLTSYRWTYRGSIVSSVSVLDINNINRTQSGQYTCTVSNTVGTDSATVNVVVQYPASITSFTINSNTDTVTVNESDHVTMRCQMDINPGSTIRLMNGSSELSRADNSLTVEYPWTTDCRQRGNYSCVASNNISSVTKSVHLIVNCEPKREVISQHDQIAAVGEDATLSLTVLSYPGPVISWFKTNSHRDLASISSVSRVSDISVTASLNLTGVQQQDFGEYIVQADNRVGQAINISFNLVQDDTDPDSRDTEVAGLIGGVVVGVFVFVALIAISAIVLYRRKKKAPAEDKKVMTVLEGNGSNHGYENETVEPERITTGGDEYTVVTKKNDKFVCAEVQRENKAEGDGDRQRKRPVNNLSAKRGIDAAGCKYIDVEISPSGGRPVLKQQEEKTEYAFIKPGVYGDPLPEDEGE